MKHSHSKPTNRGFTLFELLVVVCIITALAVVTFVLGGKMREKSRKVVDIGKMRQIGSAIHARACEFNDYPYTKQEIGNSFYREWEDPLSLCQVLKDYLSGEDVWMSPAAPERLFKYKNSYCWSVASNITDRTKEDSGLSRINPATSLLWNNFNLTIPSIYNVPEAENKAGPRTPAARYRIIPWSDGVHHLRADLTVRIVHTK